MQRRISPRDRKRRPPGRDDGLAPDLVRMFATTVPGLAPLAIREMNALQGVEITDSGFDGRSDVILFEVERGYIDAIFVTRTVEDIFVEVGRTLRSEGDRAEWIARRVWRPQRLQRALSIWSERVRPLARSMKFRVITRVLHERSFLRTDLRREFYRVVQDSRPMWKFADPAQIEVWISEYSPGRVVAGLRLSGTGMRQHDGRIVERAGALRPAVAAAMVGLAGDPIGTLLDPCCGSGTILSEALVAGWVAEGRDIDPRAVKAAERNVPGASIRQGDARHLDLDDRSVSAYVSNLPFGRRYKVQGEIEEWLVGVLSEAARVTRPGGRVVLLAPNIPPDVLPTGLRVCDKYPLLLLGTKTAIWICDRA